jgi:N-acetyl-anhydromuramyl-L-alanine amidase AmpD
MTDKRSLTYHGLSVPVTFIPAHPKSYTLGKAGREVRFIVLHSAECDESATAAEALGSWSHGESHPKASWHLSVDCDSITQSVPFDDIAWHAGTVNGFTIGIEQAGRANQTAAQWNDNYSASVLANVARLIAVIAGQYDIPIEHCVDLNNASAKGICTHNDITKAFAVKGGHTDPGPNYPLEKVLAMARAFQIEAVS